MCERPALRKRAVSMQPHAASCLQKQNTLSSLLASICCILQVTTRHWSFDSVHGSVAVVRCASAYTGEADKQRDAAPQPCHKTGRRQPSIRLIPFHSLFHCVVAIPLHIRRTYISLSPKHGTSSSCRKWTRFGFQWRQFRRQSFHRLVPSARIVWRAGNKTVHQPVDGMGGLHSSLSISSRDPDHHRQCYPRWRGTASQSTNRTVRVIISAGCFPTFNLALIPLCRRSAEMHRAWVEKFK